MKAEDLMIGDLVRTNKKVEDEYYFDEYQPGEIIKVREILDNGINPDWCGGEVNNMLNLDAIEPIPLTPEILEKNGFLRIEYNDDIRLVYRDGFRICVDFYIVYLEEEISKDIVISIDFAEKDMYMPIKYVHELQHALKLCEIKIEIEL